MTSRATALILMVALLAPAAARAVGDYPPRIEGTRVEIYKTVGDTPLKLWIFSPKQAAAEPRPAIVLFFGGGWKSGSPQQFEPQCRHLAEQGMVAITAEDRGMSAAPNALVLFNPALVLAPLPGLDLAGFGTRVAADRLGTEPKNLSPAHHVKPDGPPTIIFHGSADETVPLATAEAFAAVMRQAGNRCEVVASAGQPHGFFNREPWRSKTLAEAATFLESLGWLDAAVPAATR